jgi:hypothetical protein
MIDTALKLSRKPLEKCKWRFPTSIEQKSRGIDYFKRDGKIDGAEG